MAKKQTTATPREQSEIVRSWMTELDQAKEREKDFRKDGRRILKIYEGGTSDSVPFNILFSNTETLVPALYSALPRPVVERRYHDQDGLGKASAVAAERLLAFHIDTQTDAYESFDQVCKAATLDALLPGRAFSLVSYDAAFAIEPADDPPASDEPPEANASAEPTSYLEREEICLESKVWDRVLCGYAKHWSKMPWIAFEEYIDETEATRLFGATIAAKMTFSANNDTVREGTSRSDKEDRNQGQRKTACLYVIWDKDGGKKVRYVSSAYPDDYCKVMDDPLQLTGFYPIPRPLQFIEKAHNLIPTAFYMLYENQASELNRLTKRITRLVEAIKARGIYDGELGGDLANLMKADDNELIPAEKGASIAAEKGLQNAIWFMPLQELIATLTQLYQARETCKQVIYEITGIADIMRGATKASETLGAQQIKNSWGTLRIKNKQKEVQRYVRDLLRLILELAATKFSEETWAKMTGLPYLTTMQDQQLQMQMQAMQSQQMQQPMMPGQPPAPPNPQLLQLQQQLQQPKWADVLGLLKDDLQRAYRIDIETNSTIEPEAADDQKNITDVMTAIGQVMNGIGPLVQQQILPFEAAKVMLLMIARRFRFGRELESTLEAMQPPKPPQEDQAAQLQAQQQAMEQQLAVKQQQSELTLQSKQMQAQQALQSQSNELAVREMELKGKEELFAMREQLAQQQSAMRDTTFQTKVSAADKVRAVKDQSVKSQVDLASQDTDLQKTAMQIAGQIEIARMSSQQAEGERQEQQVNMQQVMETQQKLLQAIVAPRTRKAVRGPDQRIESVEETIHVG